MREGMGWGLFVVALIVIAYMYFSKTPINVNIPASDGNVPKDDNVKCELKDAYGRTVTITGKSDDPQFQRMCQSQVNQPVYLYGYPYTFIRFWRPRHHPIPPPPPPPAP